MTAQPKKEFREKKAALKAREESWGNGPGCLEGVAFVDGARWQFSQDQLQIEKFEKEIKELNAKLWVAKDSSLRTYDGLTEKADRADDLESLVKELEHFLIHCMDWNSASVSYHRHELLKKTGYIKINENTDGI